MKCSISDGLVEEGDRNISSLYAGGMTRAGDVVDARPTPVRTPPDAPLEKQTCKRIDWRVFPFEYQQQSEHPMLLFLLLLNN